MGNALRKDKSSKSVAEHYVIGVAISDIFAGMYAVIGILSALIARKKTGRGQLIDISLLDGLVSILSHQAGNYLVSGVNPKRLGSAHPTIAPYQAFQAADSYFVIAVGNDALWQRFCQGVDLPELGADLRFTTNPDRVKNRAELTQILNAHFQKKPATEWLSLIQNVGVPCGPVLRLSEVFNNPQVLSRKMVEELEHPSAGHIKVVGTPLKLSLTPASVRTPPPILGEHTTDILQSLGYTTGEITEFIKSDVIQS